MEEEQLQKINGENGVLSEEQIWVRDSSLDFKGRLPRRSSTGLWKASLFIISIEFSERLSFFGVATNLISYLTKVLNQDLKTAAKNVNYWAGVTTTTPLVGAFIADAYTGRFPMVVFSSLFYLMGLSLLTICQYVPVLKPCSEGVCENPRKIHVVVFFLGLYFLSVGTGGHKPCLESFGADQFDDDHPEERKKKMSFFNWWNFALCCGLLLGVTVIVYVQDFVGWGVANLVLAITMGVAIATFYLGRPCYRYRVPQGSPLTPLLQVLVAAFRKRNLAPLSPSQLYEKPSSGESQRFLGHTDRLRFLDKAAIMEDDRAFQPWRLATLTQVEETKLVLNVIPIWLTSLAFGICVAQSPTFFVKQAATMDLNLSEEFRMPPASIYSLGAVGMIISVTVYEKILAPAMRKVTGNERGINMLRRIGFGMVFAVLAMAVAAIVERKRLTVAEKEIAGGKSKSVSMSVFWLAPQYVILGIGEGFTLVGLQEYFYDQVPDSMRSLGIAFYLSVIGGGSFLSSFLITMVDHITAKTGRSWFADDVNRCRLDKFYWLLTALNAMNLIGYVILAGNYTYKKVERREIEAKGTPTNERR